MNNQKIKFPPRRVFFRYENWPKYLWLLRTHFHKLWIFLQDLLGIFPYQFWIRTVEKKFKKDFLNKGLPVNTEFATVGYIISTKSISHNLLQRTIKSLNKQKFVDWILVLFIPEGSELFNTPWLQKIIIEDPRIKVRRLQNNENTGDWWRFCTEIPCSWLVPLCPGDKLSDDWSYFFSKVLVEAENADIVYWDEDTITGQGKRIHPFLKPDWSPELLYSINFLETAAFRASLVSKLINGSTDEWVFHITNAAKTVIHIPFILQHRYQEHQKLLPDKINRHASGLKSFLVQKNYRNVQTEIINHEVVRVRWKSESPFVSIIIPTKNNLNYIKRCLSTLFERTQYSKYEVIIMDDHSTDSSVFSFYDEIQTTHNNIRVINNSSAFNYSRINNDGASLANGDLLLFLNNDIEIISADWLEELVRWALLPDIGIVGAKLLFPNQSIQHAGVVMGMLGHAAHVYAERVPSKEKFFVSSDAVRNVSAVTGACMLIKREVFNEVGGFDEDFLIAFSDIELALRVLKKGYRIVYNPAAELIHYESKTRTKHIPENDIKLGAELFYEYIKQGDPYYNQNLSLAVNWPTLKRKTDVHPLHMLEQILRFLGHAK